MFFYRAYGLDISCRLPLPELQPAGTGGDVFITFDPAGDVPAEVDGRPWYVRVTPEVAVIRADDLGVFIVRGGRHVTVIPAPGADDAAVRLYIAGTLMAILLYQRGTLALHASAIEIGGEGVAFLGMSGAGKSSMAAALQARGHAVVADDVTAIQLDDRSAITFPAFPMLKLMPEAAASVGCNPGQLVLLHRGEEKLGYRPAHCFDGAPLPIRQLYILVDDTAAGFERVRPHEAVVELIRHSYPTRMLQAGGPAHFLRCGRLARTVPIYCLKRPRSLSSLPDVARLVEEHVLQSAALAAV